MISMAGDQTSCVPDEEEKPLWDRRWMSLLFILVIVAVLVWVFATSHFSPEYLPARTFAGCYLSPNGDPILLGTSGTLRSRGLTTGKFEVHAPVGGKHGPLVEAEGLSVAFEGDHVIFKPGTGGFFWAVNERTLRVVFAPNGDVRFTRAPVTSCQ